MMKIFSFVLMAAALISTGCSSGKNITQEQPLQQRRPDYSNLSDWAAHPWKWDPSDSIPKPLRKSFRKDSVVDVFFVHPTTLTSKKFVGSNADLDDAALNNKTDLSSILYQASIFNEQARVFAPRYRQAHYRNYFIEDTLAARLAFELAYQDVKNAFEYYLQHYNNGRPIIVASHSQGTTHAARLLREYFEGKLLQNKLVCAYVIGMATPADYFVTLSPCKDSASTGCFLGWRTFKKGSEGSSFTRAEKFSNIVTNPLSWNTGTANVPASANKGAVLTKFNKISKGTSAQVHNNILWTDKPKFFGSFLLRTKNYHIGDMNLFYMNIREDVMRRIGLYWKQ
ncbi:MAG: DUF3089 domain-containing protein [Chitinophagaceae bacterium]|nr:MAG: DUF3089 domain-containing protein [Chitinophagaceae bacterium]